jgi:predicted lipid-binding transport protein (Tim44 family)
MSIVNAEPNFDPPKFLSEAENSFRAIVTAFAAGDRTTLKSNLSPSVYQTFDSAISSREQNGHRHRTEIKSILSSTIEDAQLIGEQAAIIVRFTSDQINQTVDTTGGPIDGSDTVSQIVDLWTFEHLVRSKDQIWRLAAARSG